MEAEPAVRLCGMTKTFPGVCALDAVDLEVRPGEIHAICGENGAGKSTLMNILAGIYRPDGGHIEVRGARVRIESQRHSQELGIATVYQDRSLVEDLSVAENIFANRQPVSRLGLIDAGALRRRSQALLEELEMRDIDPGRPVGRLSAAQQQMVEIAKALSQKPRILLLDEPTAAITEDETRTLFAIMRRLAARGVAIVYISHRMAEIFAIADRVSVLKDGRYQGTLTVAEAAVDEVIRLMVGRDLERVPHVSHVKPNVALEVNGLSGERFRAVSFRLCEGEILALAGLVGAGRTEVARAIVGADPLLAGVVRLGGVDGRIRHPADAIRRGIGYLPEDRKEQGLFLEMAVEDNVVSARLGAAARRGWLSAARVTELAEGYRARLRIVTPSVRQRVLNLSGGNQQKVVLAKWLLLDPRVLIVDEPTRGIDVGAKAAIYAILHTLAAQGTAILVISSDLPEVLTISDRILVMCNGRLTGELARGAATEEEIMHYASGTKTQAA